MMKGKFLIAGLMLTLFWACSSDSSDNDDPNPKPISFERKTMLENWADNIIIPSYEAFTSDVSAFKNSFDTFKGDPSEVNLVDLRAKWLQAYKAWQHVEMFEIGPAESAGLGLNINTFPTDINELEGHISGGNYDLTLSSNRDSKGFSALDYLLNGTGADDVAIVNVISDQDYISFIEAVISDIDTASSQVLDDWKTTYKNTFVSNDGASATASVDRLVNDYIFYFEKFLRAGKMGIPLGIFSTDPLPEKLEAYHKEDVSNELFLEGLDAFQNFFNGKHFGKTTSGESLASYLEDLNQLKNGESLKDAINNQINAARAAVEGLSTFKEEIENNTPPIQMRSAYDEVQKVVPLLKVDMVSAMNISIDFVDADGD